MYPTNIRLPDSTHEKLKIMARKTNMGKTVAEIVKNYSGEPLIQEGTRFTGLNLDDETLAALDKIQVDNNVKSRNQALVLLIEQAWKKTVLSEYAQSAVNQS